MGKPVRRISAVLSAVLLAALLGGAVQGRAAVYSGKALVSPPVQDEPVRLVTAIAEKNIEKMGKEAQAFIGSMGERAVGFLASESMTQEQKEAEFRKLLRDSFDLDTIGRFALGRYWRISTPEQRTEYTKLFKEMVVRVYVERFREYQGQSFEARSFRADGEKDVVVTSFIVPQSGPEVQVDWRVRNKGGKYRIVDVIVEGVSMSVTQRSDFSAVIQRGGGDVSALLVHLREQ